MPSNKVKKEIKRKAWAILLQYENDRPYIFGIAPMKADVADQYKRTGLYKPEYSIIPVQITYQLPPKIKSKKK